MNSNLSKYYLAMSFAAALLIAACNSAPKPIDRFAVVSRHNVVLHEADTMGSLSVGNGRFAFTVDASGLQSFPEEYENGIALGTQSEWGWHRFPQKENYTLNDVAHEFESCDGTKAPYAVQRKDGRAALATDALRANPHRLHLGLVGLILTKSNGEEVSLGDLQKVNQELDLWSGKISSSYEIEGVPVNVVVYANHEGGDGIAAKVTSPLIADGRLRIKIDFPYGADCHVCAGYDLNNGDKHRTEIVAEGPQRLSLARQVDSTSYFVDVGWNGFGHLVSFENEHHFEILPAKAQNEIDFFVYFSKDGIVKRRDFSFVEKSNKEIWEQFWNSGGAIDFSQCTDPRAKELERRVVLSQYLTRIQGAGTLPPQETGLTMNSWYGKFHLEMHWWHAAHFPLWGRASLLERSMDYYNKILPQANATAQWQHYTGARWPKMTDPQGNESPSSVGAFIIWQQPHPIYFAELLYRDNPTDTTLRKYQDIVFSTADFMSSFVKEKDGKYHLCHPLIPAQEIFKATETDDPTYELQYWYFGLATAQQWRERLGMKRNERWDEILRNLAPLPIKDGLYLPNATTPAAYSDDQFRRDHPAVVGAYGFLPLNDRMDQAVMAGTLDNIAKKWQWETTWGWDYPLLAMTAARLNKPELAIDLLLKEEQKNTYLINGHNYQDKRLRLYLPGNGGTLAAVAMMAAGWDGSAIDAPGFPKDGKWRVRWEGLRKMP